jgi:multiple antibiotic resistance protein
VHQYLQAMVTLLALVNLAMCAAIFVRIESAQPCKAQPNGGQPQASLAPLILFAASPGTITGVIALAVAHSRLKIPVTALIAVGVATAVMWITIVVGVLIGSGDKGDSFVRDAVTRFMGLIVIAMGVQFSLTGILSFFSEAGPT